MSQEKNELFPLEALPPELITQIAEQLDKTDESQAAKSARTCFPIFRSEDIQTNRILTRLAQYAAAGNVACVAGLYKIRSDLHLQILFTLAGLGAQNEMQAILEKHPEDLLAYGPLRDISGAEFESISIFQHAIWAKDIRYMAPMMLDCLPHNEQGEELRIKLTGQYNQLIDNGVVYHLHGQKHEGERHFSLEPLLTALDTYVTNYANWTPEQRGAHWCMVVGLAQTLLPAHIRHHYCDPEVSFWDNPDFKAPNLERSLEIYNYVTGEYQLWSESLVGCGSNFGVEAGGCVAPDGAGVGRAVDLAALTALDKVRTEIDIPALKKRLDTPIQIQKLEEDLTVQGMKL